MKEKIEKLEVGEDFSPERAKELVSGDKLRRVFRILCFRKGTRLNKKVVGGIKKLAEMGNFDRGTLFSIRGIKMEKSEEFQDLLRELIKIFEALWSP